MAEARTREKWSELWQPMESARSIFRRTIRSQMDSLSVATTSLSTVYRNIRKVDEENGSGTFHWRYGPTGFPYDVPQGTRLSACCMAATAYFLLNSSCSHGRRLIGTVSGPEKSCYRPECDNWTNKPSRKPGPQRRNDDLGLEGRSILTGPTASA